MEEALELVNPVLGLIIETISDNELTSEILNIGTKVIDTAIPSVKITLKLINHFRILKFKSFLKGINSSCVKNKKTGKELGELLTLYSKKIIYADFIVNSYEAAIKAKSKKNTATLGYYLAHNVFIKKDITLEEMIILNCLSEMTDTETDMFLSVFNKVKEKDGIKYFNPNEIEVTPYDTYSIQLMVEGLKNHRIVSRGIGGFEFVEQFGVCIFTETTQKLYDLLVESCVYSC